MELRLGFGVMGSLLHLEKALVRLGCYWLRLSDYGLRSVQFAVGRLALGVDSDSALRFFRRIERAPI